MGNKKTPEAYRAQYRMGRDIPSNAEEKPEPKERCVLEMKSDGTQISERKILMSETDMKNPTFVLKAHGFDPKEFELVNARNNFWSVISKEEEKIAYQSRITVKPRTSNELTKEDIEEIVSTFNPVKRRIINQPTYDKPMAFQINFADSHVGAFDYETLFQHYYNIVAQAKEIMEMFPIEKVYICFLGDFLHVDTMNRTTTKGTSVELEGSPKTMVEKGYELVMQIIDELSVVETEVIWIEGNHSRFVEYALFRALPYIYANNPHITFDVRSIMRKAFFYKGNLVGLYHGDMKKDQMFNWIQVEHRELWAKANYVEQHCGHLHQEQTLEKGGIIQRINPTSKPQDLYEYQNGWKSNKAIMAYVWSETDNLKAQFYLR